MEEKSPSRQIECMCFIRRNMLVMRQTDKNLSYLQTLSMSHVSASFSVAALIRLMTFLVRRQVAQQVIRPRHQLPQTRDARNDSGEQHSCDNIWHRIDKQALLGLPCQYPSE